MNKQLQIRFLFLTFLIIAGTFVRLIDLGTHFSHIDDLGVAKTILTAKEIKPPLQATLIQLCDFYWQQYTAVPRHWTYAPLQFFFTTPLLHSGQNYRQILFWGRFPSFIFGVFTFFMLIYFYKRYDGLQTPAVSIALVLTVFSWENIIYAKQMESYSIGVFSAVALLLLLWEQIRPGNNSFLSRLIGSLVVVLLSHSQYEILFFAPAYFLSVFWHDWSGGQNKKRALINLVLPGLLFAELVYPMYLTFLKRQWLTSGIHWNAGPNNEFQLIINQATPLITRFAQTLWFFLKNFYIVLGSITAFLPEEKPLFKFTRFIIFILFILGLIRLARSNIQRKQTIGLFFMLIAAAWAYLILKSKLTLSPTRHSLIALPYMVFLCAEGWILILDRLHKTGKELGQRFATIPLLGLIIVGFFYFFPQRVQERKDPFNEEKICSVLQHFQTDALFTTSFTQNPAIMPSVLKTVNYFENETPESNYSPHTSPPFKTIAFIGHRDKLTPEIFNLWKYKTKVLLMLRHQPYFMAFGNPEDYKMIYREEKDSDIEIDPSQRTRNGTNSFYFYVLTKR